MPLDDTEIRKLTGDPWTFSAPPICPSCGYNLTGSSSNRCPECGQTTGRKELEQYARRLSTELRQLKYVNETPRYGLVVAIIGMAVLGLSSVADLMVIGGLTGVTFGFVSIGLGLNVFRTKRLPSWAIAELSSQPNYALGAIVAVMGASLITIGVVAFAL